MRAMNIAATGMQAQQTNVEVISNNIANMNTTAYNRRLPEFTDLLYQNLQRVGTFSSDNNTIVPSGIQLGLGVKTDIGLSHHRAGSAQQHQQQSRPGRPGQGLFPGAAAQRHHRLYPRRHLPAESARARSSPPRAIPCCPASPSPTMPSSVTINNSGQVSITLDGQIQPTVAGQLTLANFPNEAGLEAQGNNLFLQTPSSGNPIVANPGEHRFRHASCRAIWSNPTSTWCRRSPI